MHKYLSEPPKWSPKIIQSTQFVFEFRNSWIKEGDASAEGGFFQPELPDPSWHPMPLTPSSFWKLFQQLESLELPLGDTSRCGTSASTPSPHPLSCPASAAPKDKRMIYSQNTSRACLLFCFVFLNKRSFSQLSQRIMEGDSKVLQLVQQGRVKGCSGLPTPGLLRDSTAAFASHRFPNQTFASETA